MGRWTRRRFRRRGYGPTCYLLVCAPQAWTSGAPFMLLSALLDMQPDAEKHRLTLHQPTLPEWLTPLETQGLRVGGQSAHLRFVRVGEHTGVAPGRENEVDVRVI